MTPSRTTPLTVAVAHAAALLAALCPAVARAELRVPALFGDHAVLQRGRPVAVWGWDRPGQQVTVRVAGHRASGTADARGAWRVDLPALTAGGPHTLRVHGSTTVTSEDVLVGEVWLCAGQSNMAWPVRRAARARAEMARARHPRMRLLAVPLSASSTPGRDVSAAWSPVTPHTVGDFSAVGYFFGRAVHRALGVPVGLISAAYGGTPAEAWARPAILARHATLRPIARRWRQRIARHLRHPRGRDPRRSPARPGALFNGMVAPLAPFAVRGVIWYQGESNTRRAYQYRFLFPRLIQDWRRVWGRPKLPFYFVQLANLMKVRRAPVESHWAELRHAQLLTHRRLPHTGMAVTIDIGVADNIHPPNKQDVGARLARWALGRTYGHKVVVSGPLYRSVSRRAKALVVSFDHVDGGLLARGSGELEGFAIAGADRKFRWARARIEGGQVVVSHPRIAKPVAVRYGWANNPVCNLYNRAGLPASPFRTDDWPGMTHDKR